MTNTPSRNPMELIDRYLQAVRFWLPKSQHDLALELAEDLHSQDCRSGQDAQGEIGPDLLNTERDLADNDCR